MNNKGFIKKCHAELDSASHLVSGLESGEIPNQVWNDNINKRRGFTLLELLVVVLIIGILASIALPQYQKAVMKSRYAALKANVTALYEAEEIYHLATGEYSSDFETLSVNLTGCTLNPAKNTCTYPWGACHINNTSMRVSCQDTSSLNNAYVRYLGNQTGYYGSATCWALTTDRNDKYNKLCEREGGTFLSPGTCTTGACNMYKLMN